jgi:hypothetical protein
MRLRDDFIPENRCVILSLADRSDFKRERLE